MQLDETREKFDGDLTVADLMKGLNKFPRFAKVKVVLKDKSGRTVDTPLEIFGLWDSEYQGDSAEADECYVGIRPAQPAMQNTVY